MSLPVAIEGVEPRIREGVHCTLEDVGPAPDDAALLGSFAAAHFPRCQGLPAWLGEELGGNEEVVAVLSSWVGQHALRGGVALDLGCGPGRFVFELAADRPSVGLDLRTTMLTLAAALQAAGRSTAPFRTEGSRWTALRIADDALRGRDAHFVQADALAPPFCDRSFAVVSALMLLDTVPDPDRLLRRAEALLADGGLLLLSSSYSWTERSTPAENWWPDGPADLRRRLDDLGFEVVESRDDLVWTIPGTERTVFRYRLDTVAARRVTSSPARRR